MSCSAGPEIVNDGLVFHFDLENSVKSFKGKPTSNLSNQNLGGVSPISIAFVGTEDGWKKYSLNGTWNRGTYPFSMAINAVRFTGSVSYTTSWEIKCNVREKFIDGNNLGRINYVNESGMPSSGTKTRIDLGTDKDGLEITKWTVNGFQYSSVFANPTTNQPGYINSRPISDGTVFNPSTDFIWVRNLQIEEGLFATKYVNGIRLDTTSIIDVSPTGSTITAANLTYRQDDTPTFDGTNDYFTLSNQAIPIYNTSYTIESWIKRSVTGANHGIIGDLQYDWFGLRITSANKVYIMQRQSNPEINSLTGTSNIGTDWTHVAVVFDITSGMSIYVNGNLDATNTNLYYFGLTTSNRGPKYIGRNDSSSFGANTHYFNGEISKLVGYTRALTESEIKQNFEATRSRYGI